MIQKTTLIFYKHIPSERYAIYKDRHRPIHARSIEIAKQRMKIEKRNRIKDTLEDTTKEIARQRQIEKEYAAVRYRLLNVI